MAYKKCPNCGNEEKGFKIVRCDKCGYIGCQYVGGSSVDGCRVLPGKTLCARCEKSGYTVLDVLGWDS